jgi:hypothetical protein
VGNNREFNGSRGEKPVDGAIHRCRQGRPSGSARRRSAGVPHGPIYALEDDDDEFRLKNVLAGCTDDRQMKIAGLLAGGKDELKACR